MNVEVQRRWVAALRSGEYEQTRGALNRGGRRCCALGVLCELAAEDGALERVDCGYRGSGGFIWRESFPHDLDWWAGFEFDPDGIARLNDGGMSFEGLANFIESKPASWRGR